MKKLKLTIILGVVQGMAIYVLAKSPLPMLPMILMSYIVGLATGLALILTP